MPELTGLPADPECAHCVLGPHLMRFLEERPQACRLHVANQVLQLLGEIVASHFRRDELVGVTSKLQRRLALEIHESAIEFAKRGLTS